MSRRLSSAGLAADHRINRDELFLPFLSVLPFDDLDEAIADANRSAFGLTAGIYTQDKQELDRFLTTIEAGVLYANRASGATTGAWPGFQTFCGWKGSGTSGKGGLGSWYVPQFMREQSHTIVRHAVNKIYDSPKAALDGPAARRNDDHVGRLRPGPAIPRA